MVVFAIPAWVIWTALVSVLTSVYYAGVRVGDYDWPWEHQHEGDEDDGFEIPLPESAKKALGGLLILGALILGATLLTGRGK